VSGIKWYGIGLREGREIGEDIVENIRRVDEGQGCEEEVGIGSAQ